MKALMTTLVVISILLITPTSQAGTPKFPDNPDKYPSISLSGYYQGGSGEATTTDIFGVSASRDLTPKGLGAGISLAAPVSNNVSLWGNLIYLSSELEGEATFFYNKYESQITSFGLSAGLTIYFIGE